MCVVSNIGDQWRDNFPDRWPQYPKPVDWPQIVPYPYNPDEKYKIDVQPQVSKEDFEALKKEVEELKKLLLAAKVYDEKTGQKNCEMDEKVEFIKKVAEFVGVDLSKVFK